MTADAYTDDYYDAGTAELEYALRRAAHFGLTRQQLDEYRKFSDVLADLPDPVACSYEPEMWFSTSFEERDYAKSVCARCPVLDACKDYTNVISPKYGIWAGQSTATLYRFGRKDEP
ncbi:hypothetical protein ABH903_003466 [Brevibacterium epidermidis]|jgi:hypothetical protein|uniref:4Fe-4S Wbl-type domain-containing protein n=1 Tax=Brevibacterium epidermidis TaxID=1698 RepID=A0ABV4EPF2_BREEP